MTDTLTDASQWLENLCEEMIFATGAQLAVSVGGRPPDVVATGEQLSGRPMTDQLVFNVWCASKPVVALAALGLFEADGIDLDQQLSSIAPDTFPDHPGLTLRRVLNHTAGLNDPTMVQAYLMGNAQAAAVAREYNVSDDKNVSYSEYGAAVALVDLIERLSGESAEVYLNEFVAANGLEEMIRFRLDDGAVADPLDHIGFYVVGLPHRRIPLFHDALPVIAQSYRPMVGAYASATGLCEFYRLVRRILVDDDQGAPMCPSQAYFAAAVRDGRRVGSTYDQLMFKECDFTAGFMTDLATHGYGDRVSPMAIGHTGMLGSPFGFYDPDADVCGGVILNGLSTSQEDTVFWRPHVVGLMLETGGQPN